MIQKITPNLWFDGNAKQAVDFYVSVFEGSTITATTYYPSEGLLDFQQALAGKELTITFELAGQTFVAINAGPEFNFTEAVSFSVACADQAEIDYFWSKLSHVPESEQCGWCKDSYGLSWQIVPQNMDTIMSKSDGTYNQVAWQRMMEMKKIIISELETAQ
ncbi:VOC family protein [Candidatus Saccharibacteria bacterium]|nr:MAG: VOC family protein [Candidatus Saccharibacteria bacterium]